MVWPSAVLLGDSQTQLGWAEGGWVAGLADTFQRRLDVVNRGFSGYNSRMLLAVLPDLLTCEEWRKAAVVVVFLGSNDASLPEANPEQAVGVEEFAENLLKIVAFLLGQGVARERLVLVTPPPVLPQAWAATLASRPGPRLPSCKDQELTRSLAEEVKAVAARLGVTLVDLFGALSRGGVRLESALSDGLHLGREGHAALLALLVPVVWQKLGVGPADPPQGPEWRELDNSDVAGSYKRWLSSK